jgi:hypothetical protein
MILENGVDCKDGILSDERVSVFLQVSSVSRVLGPGRTKHERTVGTKGSSNSASLTFCRYRNVAPRMYSLGCC